MNTHFFKLLPCMAVACVLSACNDGQDEVKAAALGDDAQARAEALAAKRTGRLGMAAYLGKDTQAALGLMDVNGAIQSLKNLHLVKKLTKEQGQDDMTLIPLPGDIVTSPQEIAEFKSPFTDAVIGFGPYWTELVKAMTPGYAQRMDAMLRALGQYGMNIMQGKQVPQEMEKAGITNNIDFSYEAVTAMIDTLVKTADKTDTAPVVLAAKLTPEAKESAMAFLTDIGLPKHLAIHGVVTLHDETYNGLACKVARIDLKKLVEKMNAGFAKCAIAEHDPTTLKANQDKLDQVVQSLGDKQLSVAVAVQDDLLLAFVTLNPQAQVKVPQAPAEFLLANEEFAMADPYLAYTGYGYLFTSTALNKAAFSMDRAVMERIQGVGHDIVEQYATYLNVADATNTVQAFDEVMGSVVHYYNGLIEDCKPLTVYAWQDQGLRVEWNTVACGVFDLAAPSAMSAVRPNANTFLYVAGKVNPQAVASACVVLDHLGSLVRNFGSALAQKDPSLLGGDVAQGMAMAQMAQPTWLKAWQSAKSALEAITGSGVLKVDVLPGGDQEGMGNDPVPMFGVGLELKDRAKLGQSWEQLKATLSGLMLLTGMPAEALSPQETVEDGITTFDFAFDPDPESNPVISLTDTRWVFGMPKEYAHEMIKQSLTAPARGTAPFELIINLEALQAIVPDGDLDDVCKDVTGLRITGKQAANGGDSVQFHFCVPTE